MPYRSKIFLFSALSIVLMGCETKNFEHDMSLSVSQQPWHESAVEVTEDIQRGNLEDAFKLVNLTLQKFPQEANLHMLNGVVYLLNTEQGTTDNLELAEIAFQTALNLDPNNFEANRFMGKTKLYQQQYPMAENFLSKALLLQPNRTDVLYDLAHAAYYGGDFKTALASIQRLLKLKKSPLYQRSAVIILASNNKIAEAEALLKQLSAKKVLSQKDAAYLKGRIEFFREYYLRPPTKPQSSEPKKPTEPPEKPGKILLDCFLLTVHDIDDQNFGINALAKGLALTVTPWNYRRTDALAPIGSSISTGIVGSTSTSANTRIRTITRSFGFGTLQYSTNILNADSEKIEILSRPTLSTHMGQSTSFFSGTRLVGGISGQSGGGLLDYPTGTTVQVTPTEDENGKINLNLSIESNILHDVPAETFSQSIDQNIIRVLGARVSTKIQLKPNETGLVIGNYYKEDYNVHEGFPILKDIPIIQYFFSNKRVISKKKTLLFMITPRLPQSLNTDLSEIKNRFGDNKALKLWLRKQNLEEAPQKHMELVTTENFYRRNDLPASPVNAKDVELSL